MLIERFGGRPWSPKVFRLSKTKIEFLECMFSDLRLEVDMKVRLDT